MSAEPLPWFGDPVELVDDSDSRLAEALAAGQQLRPRWQRRAACRGMDANIFHPRRGASIEPAKAICAGCIVLDECRSWSLTQPEPGGILGGYGGRQRRQLRADLAARGGP